MYVRGLALVRVNRRPFAGVRIGHRRVPRVSAQQHRRPAKSCQAARESHQRATAAGGCGGVGPAKRAAALRGPRGGVAKARCQVLVLRADQLHTLDLFRHRRLRLLQEVVPNRGVGHLLRQLVTAFRLASVSLGVLTIGIPTSTGLGADGTMRSSPDPAAGCIHGRPQAGGEPAASPSAVNLSDASLRKLTLCPW
jgi:hypothetical protein